jgi:small GTP-binding protein
VIIVKSSLLFFAHYSQRENEMENFFFSKKLMYCSGLTLNARRTESKFMTLNLKIIFGGDGSVGKTSYLRRYTTGEFIELSKLTIGTGFFSKKIKVKHPKSGLPVECNLLLWDFGGQERFRHILNEYVLGALGGLIFFDVSRYSSFVHVSEWADLLRINDEDPNRPMPLIMVGNKVDLDLFEVDPVDIEEMKNKIKAVDYIECSCKTGLNIDYIMEKMVEAILLHQEKTE